LKGILAEKWNHAHLHFDAFDVHARLRWRNSRLECGKIFPTARLKRLDRYAQFSVASAKMALDYAALTYSRESATASHRVSFGTALVGVCAAEDHTSAF